MVDATSGHRRLTNARRPGTSCATGRELHYGGVAGCQSRTALPPWVGGLVGIAGPSISVQMNPVAESELTPSLVAGGDTSREIPALDFPQSFAGRSGGRTGGTAGVPVRPVSAAIGSR